MNAIFKTLQIAFIVLIGLAIGFGITTVYLGSKSEKKIEKEASELQKNPSTWQKEIAE